MTNGEKMLYASLYAASLIRYMDESGVKMENPNVVAARFATGRIEMYRNLLIKPTQEVSHEMRIMINEMINN